mmetsp:Transcript_18395/g.26730  ORF Transcript_18395/g.26730 Transcript_18395/m.26730 type:complete len:98 (-) Transcript_18395:2069-2362(-)
MLHNLNMYTFLKDAHIEPTSNQPEYMRWCTAYTHKIDSPLPPGPQKGPQVELYVAPPGWVLVLTVGRGAGCRMAWIEYRCSSAHSYPPRCLRMVRVR